VRVLPIGEVAREVLVSICDSLLQVFPGRVEATVSDRVEVPTDAFNERRGQYSSTRILKRMGESLEKASGDRVVGVAEVDLFVPWLSFVFGEAECPGRASLISLFRLRPEFYGFPVDERLLVDRAVKEAVHELGHTFGLTHCNNSRCVMFFSNNIADTDHKGREFCGFCRQKLSKLE
jgi:archaemetzincin